MAFTQTDKTDVTYFYDYPAASTAAGGTINPPSADEHWVFEDIVYAYDLVPAAGLELTIAIAGVTIFKVPVPTDGPRRFPPIGGLRRGTSEVVTITLEADSGSATGYLFVQARKERN